jgi:23S rRNA (adenine2503-C2)-methyltransferase
MIGGLNDSAEDARKMVRLLRGIPCKVNLIPCNPRPGSKLERPDSEKILAFQKILTDSHMTVFIRESRGRDISAACGQLKGGRN